MSAHLTRARIRAIALRLKAGATPEEMDREFGVGWQRLDPPTRAVEATPRWFAEHLRTKPHTDQRKATKERHTSELSEVANSFLKRKILFEDFGTYDDCLDVVRAELRSRGCVEPDAILFEVDAHVYGSAA